jgi:hypothetical protein
MFETTGTSLRSAVKKATLANCSISRAATRTEHELREMVKYIISDIPGYRITIRRDHHRLGAVSLSGTALRPIL